VLRGLLVGGRDWHGVRVADDAPQGSIFHLANGTETLLHTGAGAHGVRAA
jgi:probable phosphoglycerate mutase